MKLKKKKNTKKKPKKKKKPTKKKEKEKSGLKRDQSNFEHILFDC